MIHVSILDYHTDVDVNSASMYRYYLSLEHFFPKFLANKFH